ncbi:hypothetical protein LINPERPRIM_LOCUS23392 [Linum perenne]
MLITFNELLFYTSILTYFLTKQVMCTSSRISMMLEI